MSSGGPPVGDPAGDGEGISLEAVLARKPSRRRQALRFAALLAALLALSALLLQYRAAQTVPPQPTPSGPGVMTVIESNTTWGTLTVNGRRLPGPPPQSVTLYASADNVITLDAPPFAPATCHVTAVLPYLTGGTPRAIPTSGNCEYGQLESPFGAVAAGTATVAFVLTGGDLPAEQRAATRQAITTALAPQEVRATVPVGEYYATAVDPQGRVVSNLATAPLGAAREIVPPPPPYTPPSPTVANSCSDLTCGGVSFEPGGVPAGRVWSIVEPLFVQWRFTDMTGAQVGEVAFGPLAFSVGFQLGLASGGQWQVVSMSGGASIEGVVQPGRVCELAVLVLQAYGISASSGWSQPVVGPLGCGFVLKDELGQPNNGLFVWRFGVLLAGDAKAHQLLPALPIAPPREIAEAGDS